MPKLKCAWCEKPLEGDAVVERGVAIHRACIPIAAEHHRVGVASSPESSLHYVFIAAAVEIDDGEQASPRPDTWPGFIRRFRHRHGRPTDRMVDMLREAYIAGAVDGASASIKVTRMGKT